MFVTVELLYGTEGEREKGKESDGASVTFHATDVKVEDIRMCTGRC
jgi:hypothetical protein